MEVFLSRIRQLLPVLGSDLLIPIAQPAAKQQSGGILFCRMKGAEARGHRTPDGFVVLKGSTAVLQERNQQEMANVTSLRKTVDRGWYARRRTAFTNLQKMWSFLVPARPPAVIEGGSANGLIEWKTKDGVTLKQLDEQA